MTEQIPQRDKVHLGEGADFPDNSSAIPVEPLDRQTIRKLKTKGRKAVEKNLRTLSALTIEYVSIDEIFPNAYNPNRQSEREFELLKMSIMEDGFTQPVLVQRDTKQIIDGEHRWRAMKQLGFDELAVVFTDMTAEQARISTLRHNRARGSEDINLSAEILKDLAELGSLDQAIDSLGISEKEVNLLISQDSAPTALAGDEFTQAWIPTNAKVENEPEKDLSDRHVSVTENARTLVASFDSLVENADSLMQQGEISKKMGMEVERITITFKDPTEVNFMRSFLGNRPSERMLVACCFYLQKHPEGKDRIKSWDAYYNYINDIIEKRVKEDALETSPNTHT